MIPKPVALSLWPPAHQLALIYMVKHLFEKYSNCKLFLVYKALFRRIFTLLMPEFFRNFVGKHPVSFEFSITG
jgi:hypothetical protein